MSDETLHVEFYKSTKEDKAASIAEGRPIFTDVEMVKINFPGDRKRELHAPADETTYIRPHGQVSYKDRFPQHYAGFLLGAGETIIGTPLSALTLTDSRVAELGTHRIKTVEQLAGLTSLDIPKFGSTIREDHAEAKAYLEANAGGSDVAELKARIAELEALAGAAASKTDEPDDEPEDEFSDMTNADIKAAIKAAGGTVPSGKPNRADLVEVLRSLGEAA